MRIAPYTILFVVLMSRMAIADPLFERIDKWVQSTPGAALDSVCTNADGAVTAIVSVSGAKLRLNDVSLHAACPNEKLAASPFLLLTRCAFLPSRPVAKGLPPHPIDAIGGCKLETLLDQFQPYVDLLVEAKRLGLPLYPDAISCVFYSGQYVSGPDVSID